MNQLTAKKCETMCMALSISVAAMELSQEYRKQRIKSLDTAIMYLKAAICELQYGENADIDIVIAAWKRSIMTLQDTKLKKKFPSGGVFSNIHPGEPEYIIRK